MTDTITAENYSAKFRELTDIEDQMMAWSKSGRNLLTWQQYTYYQQLANAIKEYRRDAIHSTPTIDR